mmetsp:Transcript_6386/g.13836  ORF Transcript_6386/g.13836 Transcript_6386/m.13836 type:complete len:265 (-) Transcript_6386:109-903(-)
MISSSSTEFQTMPTAMWATQLPIMTNSTFPKTISAFSARLWRSPHSYIIEKFTGPSSIRRPKHALSNSKRHFQADDDDTDDMINKINRNANIIVQNFQQNLQQKNNSITKLIDVSTTLFTMMGTSSSIGALWSEYTVFLTGCGPSSLPDSIERGCYFGVLVLAGLSLILRIVTFGDNDLSTFACSIIFKATTNNHDSKNADAEEKYLNEELTLLQWRIMEWSSLLAVLGAFVSLAVQIFRGEQLDGMSGINVDMCRALRDMDSL